MSRQQVSTNLAPRPAGPYSQAIAANGFLFTAGQTPHDPITDDTVGTTIEEQTAQAMKNLAAVLDAHVPRREDDGSPAPPGQGLRWLQRHL